MNNRESDNTLEQEKLDLIQWIAGLKEETVIERLKMLKENPTQTDWWDEIPKAEKSSIEEGLADIEEGKLKPHSEAINVYGKWI